MSGAGRRGEFDVIVIGAGSAGCAAAARLSEDPRLRVCLVEAGGRGDSPLIEMPFGIVAMLPRRLHNWGYWTVPQAGLDGRRGYQPRGRVIGGSSAINAMIYMRGHPLDYDGWAARGAAGWAWNDVLPWFMRAEHNERGADAYHGSGGPLNVADPRSPQPINAAFCAAAAAAGHPLNGDFNGAEREGFGLYQLTQKNGRRWGASQAYLAPARARANLTVLTRAHAGRLLIEGGRCTGVELRHRGRALTLRAQREVLLCAGVFGSPQLLLLSGIGSGETLRRHGIAPRLELPGVGRNLRDHPDYVSAWTSPDTRLVGFSARGVANLWRAWGEYRREGRGLLTTNFAESGGFFRTDPALDRPDVQLHLVVGIVDAHARRLHRAHGYSCHVCLLYPKSAGTVELASADPRVPPRIDPAFLTHSEDMPRLRGAVRRAMAILEGAALAPFRGRLLFGGAEADDAALERRIRARADTIYHPVGSCRMGADDLAVVDARLRLRGIAGLRVADASVMPEPIGGNTHATCVMIGERAAAFIAEEA